MQTYKPRLLQNLSYLVLCALIACSDHSAKHPKQNNTASTHSNNIDYNNPDLNDDGEISDEEMAKFLESLPPPAAGAAPTSIDYYKVIVSGSSEVLLPGNKGVLNVWIGDEAFEPTPQPDMNATSAHIAAVGTSAKIIADAPDFDVSPASSDCVLLHPSGVNTKFYLTPLHEGEYKVSATVKLYRNNHCEPPAIPKTANTLSIAVTVNDARIKNDIKQGFIDTFWEQAGVFWKQALALLFGLALFLLRRQLKAWFGYNGKSDNNN